MSYKEWQTLTSREKQIYFNGYKAGINRQIKKLDTKPLS